MPRVVYDPSASSIVVDLLLESADDRSTLLIPVVLDTGASITIVSVDVMARLGYDPANPTLDRQRIITGSGVEYAPCTTVRSATAIGQKVDNLEVLCHDLPPESGVDGLPGINFLKRFKLTIRFRKASSISPGNAKKPRASNHLRSTELPDPLAPKPFAEL